MHPTKAVKRRKLQASKHGRKQCMVYNIFHLQTGFANILGNASWLVRPQGYAHTCVLVRNTECKHGLFVFKKTPKSIFKFLMSRDINQL